VEENIKRIDEKTQSEIERRANNGEGGNYIC
jgi:hypothetical protein